MAGNFVLARDLALALLQADQNDRDALIVLAAVFPQLGAAENGRTAGARAFRLSRSNIERYEAARLTSLAAANEQRYTLSQIWLRRAATNAPTEQAYLQTQADYRAIRDLNPFSVNLAFSLAPSSNLNGGSETEFNIIDGLPFVGLLSGDARALSGVAASADLRLRYSLAETAQQQTSVTARTLLRYVWLSDEAQALVPTRRNSDFGSQLIEFGVEHKRQLGEGTFFFGTNLGQTWSGGDESSRFLATDIRYNASLSDSTGFFLGAGHEATNLLGSFPRTNHSRSFDVGLSHVTQAGNQLTGLLLWETQTSDNRNERLEAFTAQVAYSWAEPVGPVQFSFAAGLSRSHYPDYTIIFPVPDGRRDNRVFASLSATLNEAEYAGFVPVLTLNLQDTESNVSRFSRNEASMNISIRSSF